MKKLVPEAFKTQLASLRAENNYSGDFIDLKLIYGNKHEIVPAKANSQNTHRWTMFVKFSNKNIAETRLIEKVRYGLHPTFGMDYMDVKAGASKNYEMAFTGWGTFWIPITIHFRRDLCLPPE